MSKEFCSKFVDLCHDEYNGIRTVEKALNDNLRALETGNVAKRQEIIRLNHRLVHKVKEFVDNVSIILNVREKTKNNEN